MSDARFLLSDAALPAIVAPKSRPRTERRFRLPSCIGKPADYKLGRDGAQDEILIIEEGFFERAREREREPEPTETPRFAERTMKWFTAGDDQAEEEQRDHLAMVRQLRLRRGAAIAAAVGGLALAVLAVALI